MLQRLIIIALLCLSGMGWGVASDQLKFEQMSLSELEDYHLKVQAELGGLAKTSFSRKSGSIGYYSPFREHKDTPEWVEIDLGKETDIDEIVLIPSIRHDPKKGYIADGFPEALELQAYRAENDSFETIAVYKRENLEFGNVYPMIIPVDDVRASRVRVMATRLGESQLSSSDLTMTLQLAEIMIFNGEENVALRRPVSVSSPGSDSMNWAKEYLVDGSLPYQLDAASGERSLSMSEFVREQQDEMIAIDLGQQIPVSRLRIHTEDLSSTVPQTLLPNNGMPVRFILEGSKSSDFQEPELLLEVSLKSSTEVVAIMEWAFEEKVCRYIRLTSLEHSHAAAGSDYPTRMGLAEIEILSKGRNVAFGKKVTATFPALHKIANLSSLTDGRNLFGDILPLRQWITELARRHQLEAELPLALTELNKRYARQKRILTWAGLLVGVLILGLGFLFYNGRRLRKLHEAKIRGRIAANLHDELGANLHAIGLLSDLAKDSVDHRDDLIDTVERIRELTKTTGESAYRCANMMEAEGIGNDLITEIQEDSRRLLCDIEYTFNYQGETYLNQLKRRTCIDMSLFYKECLVNIIRHSGATFVEVNLSADEQQMRLIITDNGRGTEGVMPKALARRARLLRAEFTVETPDTGQGTMITLILKKTKWK